MRLQRFLDVSASTTPEEFYRQLLAFANDLDFGLVMAVLITKRPDGTERFVRTGNTPEAFLDASLDLGDTARDPVYQRLKTLSVPFIYDRDLYSKEGASDLWEAQAPYGYKTGVNVGLHLPGDRHFLLGMDREAALPRSDSRMAQLLANLQLLAVHAQDAAVRLFPEDPPEGGRVHLSKREQEVLRLSVQGKSAKVIAAMLQCSPHTVHFHIREIRTKLNASNKTEAGARAIELKLL
jgi:DNA-binding CsgD family transcriptional regulator